MIDLEPLQEKQSPRSFLHQNFLRRRSIIRIISQSRGQYPAMYSEENKAERVACNSPIPQFLRFE